MKRIGMTLALSALLCACGDGPAFGGGDLEPRAAEERSIDTSGHDQPAALDTAEQAAMATAGMVRLVESTAGLSSELGHAAGDLFPTADNPCPEGGSASSDVSGSLNRPRIRMQFQDCRRPAGRLDGVATITCQELDGSECTRADVEIGEGDTPLLFEPQASAPPSLLLMRGWAAVESDQPAGRLRVVADLTGELRSRDGPARWAFVTSQLEVDLQELPDGGREARLAGVAGFGGGAQAARCVHGRFDSQTPAEPLVVRDRAVQAGRLRMHSPPPRPGAHQAEAVFSAQGVQVQGADGSSAFYDPAALAAFCTLR